MSVAPPFVGQQPQEFELENNCYECATCGGHQKLRLHEDHLEIYETVPCPWWITFCYIPGPFLALALCNLKKTKRVPYHNITSVESDFCCFQKSFMVWGGSLWRHAPLGFQPAKADADVVAAAVMARVHALRVTQVAARAPQMITQQPMAMMQQQQPMQQQQQQKFDPQTGKPIPKFDPQTGNQNW